MALERLQTVKSILQQCYGDKSAVTDELVADILQPGLLPGAAAVFLDFVTYSSGPLPEDLLAQARPPLHALVNSVCAGLLVRQLELPCVPFSHCVCATEPQERMSLQVAGVPVSILWGEKDPWEPIKLGRAYADFDCVEEFVALPGAHVCMRLHSVHLPLLTLLNSLLGWQARGTARRTMRPCLSTLPFSSLWSATRAWRQSAEG